MTDRANKGCFKFFSCLFQRLLGMQKIVTLIAGLFSALSVFSQKKLPNPTIGKNEIEISSFMLTDNKLAFGGEFIYRLSLKGKLKIGAGGLYGPDFQNDFLQNIYLVMVPLLQTSCYLPGVARSGALVASWGRASTTLTMGTTPD
jgi:hypothetical protein